MKVEVAAVEGGMGDEIDHVLARLSTTSDSPDPTPCRAARIAVRWQIAQKLHACTEVFPDGENDRFRDLFDLQLLEDLVGDDGWAHVKTACLEVFSGRGKHAWPPGVTVYESWVAGYRALADDLGFTVVDVHDAPTATARLIERIDSA